MAFKIYTKTGDAGTTSLIGGTKVPKSDIRIESYGTVDELNSYIGLVASLLEDEESVKTLAEVQDRLFTIGSSLACDRAKETKMSIPDLHEADIALLESEIDRMTAELPIMKSFILPGGNPTVSHTHIARCVCRRAERLCIDMVMSDYEVEELVIKYLNRLSDYLFTLARYAGKLLNVAEVPWRARLD